MLSMRKTLLAGALIYTVAIGAGSLIHPPQVLEEAPQNSDKLVHASAYFLFCIIWFLALYFGKQNWSFKRSLAIAIVWSLFYGMVIEILQLELTTYRTGDFLDMLANSTGILLAALAIHFLKNTLIGIKPKF